MVDKWEVCQIDYGDMKMWSPGKPVVKTSISKFIRSNQIHTVSPDDMDNIMSYLLDNGWEPYSADKNAHHLKRKLTTLDMMYIK